MIFTGLHSQVISIRGSWRTFGENLLGVVISLGHLPSHHALPEGVVTSTKNMCSHFSFHVCL